MPRTLFWLVYKYGTWVAGRICQNSRIRHWRVDISRNESARLVVPAWHMSVTSACSQKVTVCFTLASFVDRYPVRCSSRNARIWKSIVRDGGCKKAGPYRRNQSDVRFAWLTGIRSFSPIRKHLAGKQFWANAEVKQAVASTWHRFHTDFGFMIRHAYR